MVSVTDQDILVQKAESLCYRLAPHDLGTDPLYIVRQSRIPPELGGRSICGGFTAPRLDLYLQTVIGPAWCGRGPCLVVNDTDLLPTMDSQDIETEFLGVVVHELAHILERPKMVAPLPVKIEPARIQFEALCLGTAMSEEATVREEPFAFQGHAMNFIRIVLHLCHRAKDLDVWLTPSELCAGRQYGLSHANRYRMALGDEPLRLAHASFREILATVAPSEFFQLWTDDVDHRSKLLTSQGGNLR
jgi:hypothetical protein